MTVADPSIGSRGDQLLKFTHHMRRSDHVQFSRLVIEAPDATFTLDLDPGLTVVGGMSGLEREGLVSELVGALGAGRAGVHLELRTDADRQLALFRPAGSRHRVIDVGAAKDVTAEFTSGDTFIDLLAPSGLDVRSAKTAMRIATGDLLTSHERDELIRALAQVNQNELWVAAEALRQSQRRLDDEAAAVGSVPEDADAIERIEERHEAFEFSQARLEKWRKFTFVISGVSALGVVPAVIWFGTLAALPLVGVALAATAASIAMWRMNERAQRSEEEALAAAGAQTYLGFHLQRVNGLLSSDQARKRLMQANEEHREALRRWTVIAGQVELSWALEQRGAIGEAVRLRQHVVSLGMGSNGPDDERGERTTALAHALLGRLGRLRTIGKGGESMPAILDEPFGDIDPAITPSLLELLVRSSQHQQIVLLTEDPSIVQWASLEAMTGAVSVVEPSRLGLAKREPEPGTTRALTER